MTPNTTWIMVFIHKDTNRSFQLCAYWQRFSEDLHKNGFKLIYVDMALDDEIVYAYDVYNDPHPWVIDNETGMAYSINMSMDFNESLSYFVNRTYREDSPLFYKAPKTLHYRHAEIMVLWTMYRAIYFLLIGNYVNKFIHYYMGPLKYLPPISIIHDYDGTDVFGFKHNLHFKLFLFLCLVFCLFLLQLFRIIFCKKIKKVRKFKPIVEDEEPKKKK